MLVAVTAGIGVVGKTKRECGGNQKCEPSGLHVNLLGLW